MLYFWILSIAFFDQLIKLYILNNFYYGQTQPLIKGIFHLTYIKNTGGAFGIFENANTFFIIISILIIVFLLLYNRIYVKDNIYINLSFGLIIGGAVGNLIDRIRLNYVVDYLDFRIWPVFNLADSAIVVGAVLLIIYILFDDFKDGPLNSYKIK